MLSLPLSWFAWRMERARRQKEAVEAIEEVAYDVLYDYQILRYMEFTFLDGKQVSLPVYSLDRKLAKPLWLKRLLGDDFFSHVISVDLSSKATNGDLSILPVFSHLVDMRARNSHITDEGLACLGSCNKLRYIDLKGTQVTPEGVMKLREPLPNCQIECGDLAIPNDP